MSSLSCLRRLRMPYTSFMQYMYPNPLIHPIDRNTALSERVSCFQQTRSYAFKSDLKIKWVRPTKIPSHLPEKSGDVEIFPNLDRSRVASIFKNSKELETADESVQKLFTLEFLSKKWVRKEYEQMLVDRVKRHAYDNTSFEVRISKITARIRYLQTHVVAVRKDVRSKVILNELIDKRKKLLKHLRRWDYKRFEWLIDKLNIIYRPPPKVFHRVTRKDSLRMLTQRHCLGIRQERIRAFKKQLESRKENFLEEKAKALDWICEEERACGVTPSVTKEDIAEVQRRLKELRVKQRKAEEEDKRLPYNPEALGF